MSKGVLLSTQNILFKDKVATLTFIPTSAYAPKTSIICSYFNAAGNAISNTITIFYNALPNYLDLKYSLDTASPGQKLSLNVASSIGSTVSLMAIDQSMLHGVQSSRDHLNILLVSGSLLLKSGNDFTKSSVLSDLSSYDVTYSERVASDLMDFNVKVFSFGSVRPSD